MFAATIPCFSKAEFISWSGIAHGTSRKSTAWRYRESLAENRATWWKSVKTTKIICYINVYIFQNNVLRKLFVTHTCTGRPKTRAKSARCNSFSASFSRTKAAIKPHGVSETRHADSGSEATIASSRWDCSNLQQSNNYEAI